MTTTNDTNNFAKRNANQVKAVLKANGLNVSTVENMGDGRQFSINCTDIKSRVAIKRAGYILHRSEQNQKYLVFSAW